MKTILIAEDEPEVRNYLRLALTCRGYEVEFAQNGDEAVRYVQNGRDRFSLALLDILMPQKDGLEALREIRDICPSLPVVMLSGASAPANIVIAMKYGASDFLSKPVGHDELCRVIERALPVPVSNLPRLVPAPEFHGPMTPPVGTWSQRVEQLLRSIGSSDVPVLLQGETGVGKEVLARKLHGRSARAGGPFLKLNCAALPSELVESELFGYDRGAFTGAFKNTPGKFEMASGGTILLDEIGDMDFRLQAKLLQVLQDREFMRLGAKEVSRIDVRVMAATHCNLEDAITQGRFREDLYYRLNVIDIQIPPLRDRTDEIIPLAEFFIRTHASPTEPVLEIPPVLRTALLEHQWPGNVRELENVMRKYLILRNASTVATDLRASANRRAGRGTVPHPSPDKEHITALPSRVREPRQLPPPAAPENGISPAAPILEHVDYAHKAAEAQAIVDALNSCLWNRKQAAAMLQIDYKALLYKMRKLGIGERKASATA
ncbi:MAG TPA: sigma-54 dependent transcriptional regulator [Bryobacteraceae bacterium]|nr:sigma-54 dependent transcriptional regulator [Bryobacteraceae bacterium]